ncbi:MAG: hypothetical protein GEU28_13165 [Dehalococcoidia bacterium]|nr:hypothetical protein [Dehalococcoidia bacterium]
MAGRLLQETPGQRGEGPMTSTNSRVNRSTREDRAQALIAAGAVALLPGTGTAIVRGTGKAEYIVSKGQDAVICTCPDFTKRGTYCKHILAVQTLCTLYRECSRIARETGRVRLPYLLGLALRGRATLAATSAPTVEDFDTPRDPANCSGCGKYIGATAGTLNPLCLDCGNRWLFGVAA